MTRDNTKYPALGIAVASLRPGATVAAGIGGLVFGVGFWTFFEYAFHRWFLHGKGSLRPMYVKFHMGHHQQGSMDDPLHRGLKLSMTIPIMLGDHLWVGLLTGFTPFWIAAMAGYNLGYCLYDLLHWTHHATRFVERFAPGSMMRVRAQLHESHHFQDLASNFGFITSFWDKALGTYVASNQRRVRRGKRAIAPMSELQAAQSM